MTTFLFGFADEHVLKSRRRTRCLHVGLLPYMRRTAFLQAKICTVIGSYTTSNSEEITTEEGSINVVSCFDRLRS